MSVRWSFPTSLGTFADGATASSAALVDITPTIPGGGPPLIQPQWEAGMRLRIIAEGWCTSGSATPTLIMGLYMAPPATAIGSAGVLGVTTTTALPASVTQGPWGLFWEGECRAVSTQASATAGQIRGRGWFDAVSSLTQFGNKYAIPAVYANRNLAFDSTKQQAIMIGATLSATTGSPSVACESLTVELIG